MLVLSRALGEKLVIVLPNGQIVEVGVARLSNGNVRLAVEAPPEIAVHRLEVWRQIQALDADESLTPPPEVA